MVNIQPVTFPIVGTATKLSVTVLGFATDALTANTYYRLLTDTGKQCLQGNYELTKQEFATWGIDNSYLDTIVAKHLNVTIVPAKAMFMDDVEVSDTVPQVLTITPSVPLTHL